MVKPIELPYKIYRGKAYPIIDIEMQNIKNKLWIPMEVYVDSGASFSIFTIKDALRLGIDYQSGKQVSSTVGDGSVIPVYLHKLNIKIGEATIKELVGFSPRLGIGFNLLGQNIFDHFLVTFNNPGKTISFIPVRK
jgi:hypothetical protein